jgi:hypothetical protein
MGLTQRQFQQLEKTAAARNTTVDKLVNEEFNKVVTGLLDSSSR